MSAPKVKRDHPFWNDGLDKPVVLKDGTELRTLHEAAALIAKHFGRRRSPTLDAAMLMLDAAARTGDGKVICDACRMVDLVLESESLK